MECLFSFNTRAGGRRIERRNGAKDYFFSSLSLCRNAACHLTSVEQSFLIKTEGFGWTSVTFHSRQLKIPGDTADQFQSAAQSETDGSPVPRLTLSTVSGENKTEKNHCKLLGEIRLWKSVLWTCSII